MPNFYLLKSNFNVPTKRTAMFKISGITENFDFQFFDKKTNTPLHHCKDENGDHIFSIFPLKNWKFPIQKIADYFEVSDIISLNIRPGKYIITFYDVQYVFFTK
jgi:hypothetical protein